MSGSDNFHSQKANKVRGPCSSCFQTHQLHIRDNTVYQHGPRTAPCPGSHKHPLGVGDSGVTSFSQPVIRATNYVINSNVINSGVTGVSHSVSETVVSSFDPFQNTQRLSQHDETVFKHPVSFSPVIKHIPKAARPSCCSALTNLLNSINRNSSDLDAWSKLIHFGPNILKNPPKSGLKISTSKVIKDRIEKINSSNIDSTNDSV